MLKSTIIIEKCSSPIGDGNSSYSYEKQKDNDIEKCSSPIGDGNAEATERLLKSFF